MINKIVLLRHGLSLANVDLTTVLKRGLKDEEIPLVDTGIKQAQRVVPQLDQIFQNEMVLVYHSNLLRTQQTLQEICKTTTMNITAIKEDPDLREQRWGDVNDREDAHNEMHLYHEKPYDYKNPRNGESGREVMNRMKKFIKYMKQTKEKNILIVGHGAQIKYFLIEFFKLDENIIHDMRYPHNCEPVSIERENEKLHLKTDLSF